MSFSSAISGLNAAANNISVISNNIANANTTGFKESVAQFADVYSNSFIGANASTGGTTQPGNGVAVVQDTQQFTQGTAQTTGNNLDMAINGNSFFTLAPNPAQPSSLVYSRAGSFEVNSAGMITNAQGQALMAYKPNDPTSVASGFSTGAMSTVSVPSGTGFPKATTTVGLSVNLNASSTPPTTVPFNPLDPSSYTSETSTTIYDSLGQAHNMTTYYVAQGADPSTVNQTDWATYNFMTDNPAVPQSITSVAGNSGITAGGIPQNNPTLFSAPLVTNTATAATDTTTASAAATAAIAYTPALATTALNQSLTAQASTAAAAASAAKVVASTTTPAALITAAALAQSTAATAASSAAAYANSAALVTNAATAATAATAAATAAGLASAAATAYNTALTAAAPGFAYTAGVMQTFNATGQLTSPATAAVSWTPPGSATPISATMNFTGTTQIASAFSVNASSQNGVVSGTLTGVSVDSKGVISANYSNGTKTALGQVALATFNNPQGLSQVGGSNWGQSSASGAPLPGAAGSGQFGTIQSGAVEQSNVDLSEQLVNLITAQQAYQANSQSISAQNKMVETIMNAFR